MTPDYLPHIKKGDESSFDKLYSDYSDVIYGIILRITKDEFVAQTVLQDTFLKVWKNIHSYDESKGGFFAWIARIARNASLDVVRLKGYENRNKTESFDVHVHNNKSDNLLGNNLDSEKMKSMLDNKYRDVLDLVYLQGYSQKDASDKLGVPLGTVKTRLRYAVNILRDQLKNEKTLLFTIGGFLLLINIIYQWIRS